MCIYIYIYRSLSLSKWVKPETGTTNGDGRLLPINPNSFSRLLQSSKSFK